MTDVELKPYHHDLYKELIAVLRKYLDHVSPEEVLAVTANLTGKVCAMQNPQKMTSEQAMEIVLRNFHIGNQEMINALLNMPVQGNA